MAAVMKDWLGARRPIELVLLMMVATLTGVAIVEYVIAPVLAWIVSAHP